jgi:intraflagellar transport protein 81
MYSYLATEKLPKAIDDKNSTISDNRRILEGPAVTQSELNELTRHIQGVTREINVLQEQRLSRPDGSEDQLSVFRKQAAIIASKKNGTAEKLSDLQDELANLQKEYEAKKSAANARGPRVPGGEEFQAFVARLRTKSTAYKQKKAQLTTMQSEQVVIQRTIDILEQRYQGVKAELEAAEWASGVAGSLMAQEQLEHVSLAKSEVDEEKGATLDEISQMVNQLTRTIESKKELLAPLIKELRELRADKSELQV